MEAVETIVPVRLKVAPDSSRLKETLCPLTVPVTEATPEQFEIKASSRLPVTELLDWLKKPEKTTAEPLEPVRVISQLPAAEAPGVTTLREP